MLDFKNWYEKYTYYPGSITQDTYSLSFPDENPKSIDNLVNYRWYSGVTSTDGEEFVSVQNDKVVSIDVSRKITQQRETLGKLKNFSTSSKETPISICLVLNKSTKRPKIFCS